MKANLENIFSIVFNYYFVLCYFTTITISFPSIFGCFALPGGLLCLSCSQNIVVPATPFPWLSVSLWGVHRWLPALTLCPQEELMGLGQPQRRDGRRWEIGIWWWETARQGGRAEGDKQQWGIKGDGRAWMGMTGTGISKGDSLDENDMWSEATYELDLVICATSKVG